MAKINEIILKKESAGSTFNRYVNKEVVAKLIFECFDVLHNDELGYPLDLRDHKDKYGLISNCMALSTLLELYNLDAKINRGKLLALVEMILQEIKVGGRYIFSASPYVENNELFRDLDTYIESVAKVSIVMTDLRKFLIKENIASKTGEKKLSKSIKTNGKVITNYNQLISEVEDVIIITVKILNDAALPTAPFEFMINEQKIERHKLGSEVNYRGWTFHCPANDEEAEKYDTSIFYTYYASNAFLALFEGLYEQMITYFEYDVEIKKDTTKERERYVEINEEFFMRNKELIMSFREKVVSAGRYIDNLLNNNGVDIALSLVSSEFKPVSISSAMGRERNNLILDTLFVSAILINTGMDDDYNVAGSVNLFFDQIQHSLNNVRKIYSLMKKANLEDLVGSYRIVFNEKYPKEYNLMVQELRKNCRTIPVYDFVPLYCNTYSTISKYLIQYPQKEMVDNLAMIMDNVDRQGNWLWDIDGFNVNNNLYYIFALENFYDYYTEYELPLSKYGEKYNAEVERVKEERDGIIKQLQEAKDTIQALELELNNKKSALDAEVVNLIDKYFNENIENAISGYIDSALTDNYNMMYKLYLNDMKHNVNVRELYKTHARAKELHSIFNSVSLLASMSAQGNNSLLNSFDRNNIEIDGLNEDGIKAVDSINEISLKKLLEKNWNGGF